MITACTLVLIKQYEGLLLFVANDERAFNELAKSVGQMPEVILSAGQPAQEGAPDRRESILSFDRWTLSISTIYKEGLFVIFGLRLARLVV